MARGEELMRAVQDGDAARVRDLAVLGADVNAWDTDGARPLHVAAALGHAEVVRTLIALGGDKEAQAGPGARPLHMHSGWLWPAGGGEDPRATRRGVGCAHY
jgi:ankyrin repeat protein